jgi:hypothetical protein
MLTRSCIVLVLLIPTSSVAFSRTHQLERRFLDNKRDQVMVGYTPEALTRAISRYAEISFRRRRMLCQARACSLRGSYHRNILRNSLRRCRDRAATSLCKDCTPT